VDKDKADGIGRQVTGSLKEAIGKVTGDAKTQAEGQAEKQDGKRRADPDRQRDPR
jgi:uncharacterized protein YjbJ (UPF0337 family)